LLKQKTGLKPVCKEKIPVSWS